MLVDQKFWFSALTHERRKALCLQITEKVSLIAIEASYVYISSGQKFIKNAKNDLFDKPRAWSQTAFPDMSLLRGQKLVENAKNKNPNATFWMIFKHCDC